ncbi:uncharacterized protein LOC126369159 [Pectinophora gossypiella]|uniref:uncharacterized protein LOC126369159 n=1 Tax=Pectinophora gossypiella TaxID=13191 RepID=UPI00214DFF33|nr:uncharacterized protein LOC126369159 [Pectinophora gossypiella]
MDGNILLVIVSVALVVAGQPLSEGSQNFVPGVFISAEALKDLQQKAQDNQMSQGNPAPQPITSTVVDPDSRRNNELNGEQLKIGSAFQTNQPSRNVPIESQSQSQPILPNQLLNQDLTPNVPNQAILPVQNQPQIVNQPAVPDQQVLLAQPNQQTILVSQQPAFSNQQPGFINQQPGFISQQPGFTNQQPGFTNQQPIYVSQQPGNQMYVNQPPTQQVILRPGQVAQVVPQSTLIANPNLVTLYQNPRPMNPIQIQNPNTNQNPGTLYAMVPVNSANNVPIPNTNLSNGNNYLVPVQQMPTTNQIYAVSG